MTEVAEVIARAIYERDRVLAWPAVDVFAFEDAAKSATAILAALREAGYAVVPRERLRRYAKAALNGFDTLDTVTAVENAKSDIDAVLRMIQSAEEGETR